MRDQSRAGLAAYALAAVLAVVVGLKLLAPDRGGGEPTTGVRVERKAAAGAGAGGRLYVHVAGAVRRPGLYRLADGSRVAAALERAGGPSRRADLAGVNLAAQVEDGQQIVVPGPGARPAAGSPAEGGAGTKTSLASATVEQLDQLDGIGPTLAKRILEYRDEHGGFRSVDELKQVEGIGEKRFESLREAVAP